MTKHPIFSLLLSLLIAILFTACKGDSSQAGRVSDNTNSTYQELAATPAYLHRSIQQLTDVIVHDVFSPPVASRIYAYPSIAAYEVIRQSNPDYKSLDGQLHELTNVPVPQNDKTYCYPLASVHAFLTTGKALIFSEEKIEEFEGKIYQEFKDLGIPKTVYENSLAYGAQVSSHILNWSKADMYAQTRSYPKYNLGSDPAKWKPTPPSYMDGIEPHWREIRTMVIEKASQFPPPPPTEYSTDKNSQFYKETKEVYDVVENATESELAIAAFWDCNPFVVNQTGHVMFATKKITPGGHWMGITQIASKGNNADIVKTSEAYALVAINLFDAFISCWDEKYRSSLVRPETVINSIIDENWQPVLQTPPFPEHTSGHSVISTASAEALTGLFGDNFKFIDSTEVRYGLPTRSFNSFREASDEAAISRLYGGIHYRPAIDYGVEQGKAIGKYINANITMSPTM